MQGKDAVLQKLNRMEFPEGTVRYFISKLLKEGVLNNPITSVALAKCITERFGKRMKSIEILTYMKPFLNEGLVKSKFIDSKGKIRIWYAGWISDENATKQLKTETTTVLVIEPSTPFSAKRLMADLITELRGKIKICDPYVSVRTLDLLHDISKNCETLLLTQQVTELERFKRECEDFKREHPKFEVRTYDQGTLHDRFILAENASWQIGHSLKDLGTKQTNVIRITSDIREALEEVFNRRWKEAKPLG